ncbi:hypothetical protein PRIPAC_72349 [Pristionchus pacificus]|uniref:Uncharacterized protein n=1 Tax=Pristionchus pacificus TaxID=54126 RepID=A0A2A6CTB4_PRIPA|nr:hypothetical protein PRIPAC_72349 [Pristionchus pacificus]|eukprot:PDM81297.1 hypothetical protein PRIPAC_36300 [Pristionchus pacificus]
MLCDLIDDLSQEHKDLVFNVFADYEISVPDKDLVKLAQIGVNRGFNSAIHSVNLDEDRAFAVKITNNK